METSKNQNLVTETAIKPRTKKKSIQTAIVAPSRKPTAFVIPSIMVDPGTPHSKERKEFSLVKDEIQSNTNPEKNPKNPEILVEEDNFTKSEEAGTAGEI